MKKLGFGLMRLPLLDAKDQKSIDFDQVCRMADEFIARGFTYFDTAYVYHSGESENFVKRVLVERHPRDSFTIATKLPMFMVDSEEKVSDLFEEQLQKCGVDFIDYYLLHALSAESYEMAKKYHCFDFISRKKAEGKIRNIGLSFHDKASVLDTILTEHPEVDFVQIQLNYLDWDSVNVESGKCYDVCVKHNKPVVVMEPVKGGALAAVPPEVTELFKSIEPDMSEASWAVRFAAGKEQVMVVLSGMSNEQQLKDNTSYMQDFKPLEQKELDAIAKAVEIINSKIAIACTGCRYCVDGCPMSIHIPDLFYLYNQYSQFGEASGTRFGFMNETKDAGKPSDCVACGQCEGICPQHLPIIDTLKKVAEIYEVPMP